MHPESTAKSKEFRRGGQRPWLVVVVVVLLALAGAVLFMIVKAPKQQASDEDIKEQAKVVQSTITLYDQKSRLYTNGSAEFINAKGIAAMYAAENNQCDKAGDLLKIGTDGSPDALTLKKQFDDEIGRLCKD